MSDNRTSGDTGSAISAAKQCYSYSGGTSKGLLEATNLLGLHGMKYRFNFLFGDFHVKQEDLRQTTNNINTKKDAIGMWNSQDNL